MPGFGAWAARWWMPVLFIVIAGHLTNVCVTLFLHRAQTHRGVRLHYLAALPMRIWLWLTTAIVTKEWVACHRKHHAFADREGDPHSPLVEGLRNIVFKGAFYYRKAVRQPGMLEKYGKGTPNDWIERHLLSRLNWVGILVMLAHRRLPVRLLRRPGRLGRSDALDSVLGRRHRQRRRPRARLPQLRSEGREPEHLAHRDLARRRGAPQQPPRRSQVRALRGALVRVRHRLGLHPHAPVLPPGQSRLRARALSAIASIGDGDGDERSSPVCVLSAIAERPSTDSPARPTAPRRFGTSQATKLRHDSGAHHA